VLAGNPGAEVGSYPAHVSPLRCLLFDLIDQNKLNQNANVR
jgi:hypothetical protein